MGNATTMAQTFIANNCFNSILSLNTMALCFESFYLSPVELEEIELLISELNNKKSPGCDGISTVIFKNFSDIISPRIKISFTKTSLFFSVYTVKFQPYKIGVPEVSV